MKIKKDDIRTFIVVVCVCVICIVLGIILSIKSNFEKLEPVDKYDIFFSTVSNINSYINYISSDNNTAVYNLLDKNYIEEKGITSDNVLDIVDRYNIGSSLKITNMDYVKVGEDYIYYINGMIYEMGFESEEIVDDHFSIIVIKDNDNMSYSLYPIDDDTDYEKYINDIKEISIDINSNNIITKSETISKEQVCGVYLSDFYYGIFSNIDNSYRLLSDDMKDIYTNVDEYEKYINDNISKLSSTADKCKMDEIDDNRIYTVIDEKGNIYMFTEESIMNYKVEFYLKEVNE